MKTFKTPIIPSSPCFIGEKKTLDLKAICVFSALGFFLDDDSYYLEQKVLKPATDYIIDNNQKVVSKEPYFNWHYNPRERSLKTIAKEFSELFETIILEQTDNKRIILPLSGGIDSRTQAAALKHIKANVNAYSYKYKSGHDEVLYAKKITEVCNFSFQDWEVKEGYLWNCIEELSKLNDCYSEFTHPRQMAFSGLYAKLGDVFSLGHWGDVLFDNVGVKEDLPFEKQVEFVLQKVLKKGGMELATSLWKNWSIEGDFKDYLYQRIKSLLKNIDIKDSANAQIRAFKSLYWAPRWTSINLSIFKNENPIKLPYYDNRMCEFICNIPERFLSKRQIQIEYLKLRNPELAKITWQDHRPFNLYNYHFNKTPYNLPYRVYNKGKRILNSKQFIQRNWELQFLGEKNSKQLEYWLFENKNDYIPSAIVKEFYEKFKRLNQVHYSHSISTLLTLSLFFKNRMNDSSNL